MKQAGVKPGMLTYNTLISCCHQAKRLEDAFRIKAEMEAAGMRPDVVTYTALMALVVKTGPYRGRSSPAQR
jgi:pentatricopeptide repeat domain-containing protein 1